MTSGGKIFQLRVPSAEDGYNKILTVDGPDSLRTVGKTTLSQPSGYVYSYLDVTSSKPSGASIAGGIVKFYFPYIRVI